MKSTYLVNQKYYIPGGNFVQYIHLNINPFYILSHRAKNAISWVTENESFCVRRHHRHIKL